ncbi:MAG: hypothetical protein HQL31_02735 [Planctomycetes bacterium]|nr:hypothetical protein [Planctomycetota bacterium]
MLEAPTNASAAGFFVRKGFSVETVRDLRYCTPALLKTAVYIVLNPNTEDSPYYEKIRLTLQKMLPDRLIEGSGQELFKELRARVSKEGQAIRSRHPQDGDLRVQKRESEEKQLQEKLDESPKVSEIKDPAQSASGLGYSQDPQTGNLDDASLAKVAETIGKLEPGESSFVLDDSMRKKLEPLVQVCAELRWIEFRRQALLEDKSIELTEDAGRELRSQSTNLAKSPIPKVIIERYEQKLEKIKEAQAQGKVFPSRKFPEGEPFDEIIALGDQTEKLLYIKAKLRYELAQYFANHHVKDYTFKVFRACNLDSDYLHGCLYLMLALQTQRRELLKKAQADQHRAQKILDEFAQKGKKSGFSLFKKKDSPSETEESGPSEEEREFIRATRAGALAVIQLDSEIGAFEPDLVDSFWGLYEKVILLLIRKKVKNKVFLRYLRAYVRFGVVSQHPALIAKNQLDSLLARCDESSPTFAHEEGKTNILYPDDAIIQIADGIIPPSYDEELELTGEGTPRYKYEKMLKRVHSSQYKIQVYGREHIKWAAKMTQCDETIEASEKMLAEQEKGTKEYKALVTGTREAKAEKTRLQKIVSKFEEMTAKEQESLVSTREIMKEIDYTPNLEDLAAREALNVRKFCKMMHNLKEPFLPFTIQSSYVPEPSNIYDAGTIGKILEKIETEHDVMIFSEDLANQQHPRKQVVVRYSPTITVFPCMGNVCFCTSARDSNSSGRLLLPLMSPSQNPLFDLLLDTFADFRWDSAVANAGTDLMNSDTICNPYAKVKFEYSRKGKEFREKALVYKDLNEKKNFKFHYRLYVASAAESGKKLFYKCFEMYEGFTKYIPLPPGKEKLKKA